MLAQPIFQSVMEIAGRFVEKHRREDGPAWAALAVAPLQEADICIFLWAGTIPLYEVPLINLATHQASGYVLVSSSEALPPFLEYAREGLPLSRQIQRSIAPALAKAGLPQTPSRYLYLTSTEIYAEIPASANTAAFLLNVGGLFTVQAQQVLNLSMDPAAIFDPATVREQWHALTPGQPGDLPEVVLSQVRPVRYQQNCDGYAAFNDCIISTTSTRTNYCAPHAIAGCVAVGWAMLLSSWKRSGWWDSARIWPGSTCWDRDWPSWGGEFNTSQCADVEQTIWRLHALLGTTVDGATNNAQIINGAAIFGEFGLSWRYGQATGQPFEVAATIVAKGQPFLWTANGIWQAQNRPQPSSSVPGGVGHGVVAYGYKKSDRTLLIALGWGEAFVDKYVNYDQYASPACFYLSALATNEPLDIRVLDQRGPANESSAVPVR